MCKILLSFIIECIPMVAFFIASYRLNFLEATGVYVLTTALAVYIIKHLANRLPYLSLIFGFFVIGSGLLSIIFREPQILIIADSIYFFLGAFWLLRSLMTPYTLTERLFGYAFDLSPQGWRHLTWQWVAVFIVAGISNEIVRVTMSPEWWIGFQFWRAILINLVVVLQMPFCRYYRNPATTNYLGFRIHFKD